MFPAQTESTNNCRTKIIIFITLIRALERKMGERCVILGVLFRTSYALPGAKPWVLTLGEVTLIKNNTVTAPHHRLSIMGLCLQYCHNRGSMEHAGRAPLLITCLSNSFVCVEADHPPYNLLCVAIPMWLMQLSSCNIWGEREKCDTLCRKLKHIHCVYLTINHCMWDF